MNSITPKQIDFLLALEPKIKKAKLPLEDRKKMDDIINRVKKFGIRTILTRHEQDRIRIIAERIK